MVFGGGCRVFAMLGFDDRASSLRLCRPSGPEGKWAWKFQRYGSRFAVSCSLTLPKSTLRSDMQKPCVSAA